MTDQTSNLSTGEAPGSQVFAPTRRQVLAAGGMGLSAIFLAACTGGNESPSGAPSGSAGEPKKGGTLKVSVSDGDSSESVDPGLILSTNSMLICLSIYDQLITVDKDMNPLPGLAEKWEPNADATEWTFNLRKGVKWHDGSDFTSADVVASMQRWLDEKTGNQVYSVIAPYADPSGITASDDYTVVLKLKSPNGVLPATLGSHYSSMITKAGTNEFTAEKAIGTGPFKLTAWTPGVKWSAVRNDDYWNDAPYLDGLEITVTPDQGAKLQAALAGSADVTDTIPISLWSSLQGRSEVSLNPIPAKNVWVFSFDQTQAPFNDPRVIEALKMATDRETILKVALQGNGTITADVPQLPDSPFYPEGLTPKYDPAGAKALLAEAGFPDGLDIELSTSGAIPGMLDMAQTWQQVVKPAGFNITLNQLPLATYWSEGWMATPAFQDYWNRYHPVAYLDNFYRKDAAWNEVRYSDPALEDLVNQVLTTTDETEQKKLLQEAFARAAENFGYVIPAFADSAWAQASDVQGVVWDYKYALDFRKAWLA